MAKKRESKTSKLAVGKSVETIVHEDASRLNIPTAEYQSVMETEAQYDTRVAYARRNRDLDPQLMWRGKDEQDLSNLVVNVPPIYIQEKVHPKVLIDDLLKRSQETADNNKKEHQLDLFSDFNGLPDTDAKTEFYQHEANWTNRMILGDSLQVMASLAEREGLKGKVQCIYFDPPYGIKFNSNFQWSTTSRDVKDGNTGHITREPEQVKAFRDTWRDGIHSYLTYLRDRLTVARDLLTESGSIFVQIGEENVHLLRSVLDEVFGQEKYITQIAVQKTGSQTGTYLQSNVDFILWYRKNDSAKYRQLHLPRELGGQGGHGYTIYTNEFLEDLPLSSIDEAEGSFDYNRIWRSYPLTSSGFRETTTVDFNFRGRTFNPGRNRHWGIVTDELEVIGRAGRLVADAGQVHFRRYFGDSKTIPLGATWFDVGGAVGAVYVVQTSAKVI